MDMTECIIKLFEMNQESKQNLYNMVLRYCKYIFIYLFIYLFTIRPKKFTLTNGGLTERNSHDGTVIVIRLYMWLYAFRFYLYVVQWFGGSMVRLGLLMKITSQPRVELYVITLTISITIL
jgi:hypothetical protein